MRAFTFCLQQNTKYMTQSDKIFLENYYRRKIATFCRFIQECINNRMATHLLASLGLTQTMIQTP